MSTCLVPCLYKGKALEQQWVNNIFNSHDLFCGCPDALKHLQSILQPSKNQLCLPSTTDDTGKDGDNLTGDVIDGFEDGELEKLFQDDTDDETG